jgi:hypothetical protein
MSSTADSKAAPVPARDHNRAALVSSMDQTSVDSDATDPGEAPREAVVGDPEAASPSSSSSEDSFVGVVEADAAEPAAEPTGIATGHHAAAEQPPGPPPTTPAAARRARDLAAAAATHNRDSPTNELDGTRVLDASHRGAVHGDSPNRSLAKTKHKDNRTAGFEDNRWQAAAKRAVQG